MDQDYLDFGSDTDSDGDGIGGNDFLDSDEEEAQDNAKLFKMLMMTSTNPVSKKVRDVDDFEAEMEAELDKRALEIENRGGMQHQKSLSRSSSNSSLNRKSPGPSPSNSRSESPKPGASNTSSKRSSSWIEEIDGQADNEHTSTCIAKGIITSAHSSRSGRPNKKKSVKFQAAPSSSKVADASETELEQMETEEMPSSSKSKSQRVEIASDSKALYDSIYFDSDESEGEDEISKKVKKEKRTFVSNDDLFYDPDSDSKDQKWMDNRRRKYADPAKTPDSTISNSAEQPLPSSDAVLNCPACFTVLCVDCQRHDIYTSQYRAMFVMNCNITREVTLQVPLKDKSSKWKKRKKTEVDAADLLNPAHLPPSDKFNPVKCKICTTQVAVYDSDEVYHFFNVLASHA